MLPVIGARLKGQVIPAHIACEHWGFAGSGRYVSRSVLGSRIWDRKTVPWASSVRGGEKRRRPVCCPAQDTCGSVRRSSMAASPLCGKASQRCLSAHQGECFCTHGVSIDQTRGGTGTRCRRLTSGRPPGNHRSPDRRLGPSRRRRSPPHPPIFRNRRCAGCIEMRRRP